MRRIGARRYFTRTSIPARERSKTMFEKLLEILEFNETAIMALERLDLADVLPVITVMKENRRKIEALQEEAEKTDEQTEGK